MKNKPEYKKVVKRSFQITKKFKWLWVYGLTLSASGGGGGISNLRSVLSDDNGATESIPPDVSGEISKVLGATTSSFAESLGHIPISVWMALLVTILAVVIIGVLARFILNLWANGGLIYATDQALANKDVDLANSSPHGIAFIKPLLLYRLINLSITFVLLGLVPLLWFVVIFLAQDISWFRAFWITLGAVVGIVSFVFVIVFLPMIGVFAERLIVLQKIKPWEAWKTGLELSKKHFVSVAVMGLINKALGFAFSFTASIMLLIVVGAPSIWLIYPNLTQAKFPSLPALIALVAATVTFIFSVSLIQAVVNVFGYGNWGQVYKLCTDEKSEN